MQEIIVTASPTNPTYCRLEWELGFVLEFGFVRKLVCLLRECPEAKKKRKENGILSTKSIRKQVRDASAI